MPILIFTNIKLTFSQQEHIKDFPLLSPSGTIKSKNITYYLCNICYTDQVQDFLLVDMYEHTPTHILLCHSGQNISIPSQQLHVES